MKKSSLRFIGNENGVQKRLQQFKKMFHLTRKPRVIKIPFNKQIAREVKLKKKR